MPNTINLWTLEMRLRAAAGFSWVWLLLPLGLIAAQIYMSSVFPSGTSYPLADQVLAYGSSVLVQPLTCLLACVMGLRLRHSSILTSVAVLRSPVTVIAQLIALPTVGATVVLTATMASTSYTVDESLWVDPRLLAACVLESAAYALTGLAIGLALRPVLAAPLAVLAPYVLIAFAPTSNVFWVRHLTSVSGCCNIYETLSARATTAHLAFMLAILTSAFIVALRFMRGPNQRRSAKVAAAASAICVLVAVLTASPLGVSPVDDRAGRPTCQPEGGIELCLWPEHETARAQAQEILNQVAATATSVGVEVPSTLTELDPSAVRWPTASVDLAPHRSDDAVRASLAASLYPSTQCTRIDHTTGFATPDNASSNNQAVVQGWWSNRLGVSAESQPEQDSAIAQTVTRIENQPVQQQALSINSMITAAATICQKVPPS